MNGDKIIPLPEVELKKFPSKKYSFGVSRLSAKKMHIYDIERSANEGLDNPGPGTY